MNHPASQPAGVSVVVPMFNEAENVHPLYAQLARVLSTSGRDYEIVFVDDGSTDGTVQQLEQLTAGDRNVRVIVLRRNFGQTAAMQAGIHFARNEYVVTIDGDLQNEPADIPMMLDQLDRGADVVHGWRRDRQDRYWTRRLPSILANWLISKVTRFGVHDLGCTLKAIRRDIACQLELYGEMHRFIPILAHAQGARCVEVVTRHHPRRFGNTKYGIDRTFRVLLDLVTVKYMLDYFASPMKLLGKIGLWCAAGSVLAATGTVLMKWPGGVDMTGNPLLMMSLGLGIASLQFFGLGLLGEVNARIYFSHSQKQNYSVRRVIDGSPVATPMQAERRSAA